MNGKSVDADGAPLAHAAGEVVLGEPGTNGQHSFYQLMHQGRVVPAEFIGFCASQCPARASGAPRGSHDELMASDTRVLFLHARPVDGVVQNQGQSVRRKYSSSSSSRPTSSRSPTPRPWARLQRS